MTRPQIPPRRDPLEEVVVTPPAKGEDLLNPDSAESADDRADPAERAREAFIEFGPST